jgi:hypothetical protein
MDLTEKINQKKAGIDIIGFGYVELPRTFQVLAMTGTSSN